MALEQQALQGPTPTSAVGWTLDAESECADWDGANGSFNCKARGMGRKGRIWERVLAHSTSLGLSAVR